MSAPIARRLIGQTGLSVTELGFGTAPLGNLYRPVSEDEARAAMDAALEAGIRHFDTAPYYGFGLSERRVGDSIRGRRDVVLSTKVGRLLQPTLSAQTRTERHGFVSPMPFEPAHDYTREGILRSHEASVQRLGLARIDILYVHDIGRQTHGELDEPYRRQLLHGGGLAALQDLRAGGSVSAIGLGVNEIEVCLEIMSEGHFDVILLAGRYTLLEQRALDELLPRCLTAGTSIVVGGPFNSGVLAAHSPDEAKAHYNYAPVPAEVQERVRRLHAVCASHNVPLAAAALQFPLAHPAVAAVIPGFASAAEVRSGLDNFHFRIPGALWSDLRDQGLVDPRAPVPAAQHERAAL